MLDAEWSASIRRAPPWEKVHPWLLSCSAVVVVAVLVVAYFGVPTALLSAWAVALGIGHLWPGWYAREAIVYWAPVDRFLRFSLEAQGLIVESAGGTRTLPFRELRCLRSAPDGWIVGFRARPPLWMPKRAFGEHQAGQVEEILRGLNWEERSFPLGWMYVGAGGLSIAGTLIWYLSV